MSTMKVKTKNQVDVRRKPRVYFTCHPEDFDLHFQKICDDLFVTQDCAIYYTEDLSAPIPAEDLETDLGRSNLLVVPVTLKLLTTPNRAMDADIPYAKQAHIPILPIMMEPGLDVIYSHPDKFAELQYLNPNSTDATEISYEEKLKKFLESVLVSDELAQRVRGAFDAYIFLSYRKKDRRHANELMRLIHSIPQCRDIAIWFDEFLTPGESFRESIDKILHDSKLFALLVTPNLLEEGNFVMREEYPAAKGSGLPILPTEMEDTDKERLSERFPDIPDCVRPTDEAFRSQLLETVMKLATETNNTPEHDYLMGIAYLEGIDVEVNRARALELLTAAAEKDLPEAMSKLYRMYDEGIGVELNYRQAVYWGEKLAAYLTTYYGLEHPKTLTLLDNLSILYSNLGEYSKALEQAEKVYALRLKILGEEHPDTLNAINNLASVYYYSGDWRRCSELLEKAYTLRCRILGEEHPDTLTSLNNLAHTYSQMGNRHRALELMEQAYALHCRVLGVEHSDTLAVLNNLALVYERLGDNRKAFELLEEAYTLRCKVLGEEHPETLKTLSNLAYTCGQLDPSKALRLQEKVYTLRCKVLGAEHPDTFGTLNNLALVYERLGDSRKAFELLEKVYTLRCQVLGEEHPDTLTTMSNLAGTYGKLGDWQKAMGILEKVYALRLKVLGEEHPDTLTAMNNLARTCSNLGFWQKALELQEKAYALRYKVLGQEHPDTLGALNDLAVTCYYLGEYQKSLALLQMVYTLYCQALGENHPKTAKIRKNLDAVKQVLNRE